ncbi:multidrug DMT transporter permease [Rathayibacter caricis DSM 15933]|uniref:Multidrug DMT transporter permease n=1 Tax=Rathayibacter caricis DSM 15933 TaxID=1328867 RepID=A0A2T4UVS5_9MICO|nr:MULTISPECIES: DMT family transporter [Rathayibacter]KQQ19991.1 multidrug DMT transporter permease [Rathayibacter sp. Leaf299]PTL73632.1 multidrug DMT transporter permease [Rathayibacter caricis DSM 15933]
MSADLTELTEQFTLDPVQFIGIPIALVGAVFLSLGAQFQHRGVAKVERFSGRSGSSGLNGGQLFALLSRPSWVVGTLMLGLAVVFQLTSLGFSPLIVVQPLGAVALVITAVMNARVSRVRLNKASIRAIVLCVGGVGTFVLVAAFNAVDKSIRTPQLITILVILGVVLVVFVVAFRVFRRKARAIFYILGAGVVYGFVATLAKVVLNRIKFGEFDPLTVVCIVALLAASALGGYFVQNAYSSGPPDLVVAGLTVIDPLVAVAIGIIVLGEAQYAAPWAIPLFVIAGAVAIWGVLLLAKHHPQAR